MRRRLPLIVLLVATALVYLVAISRNGMANEFYAASVWAGSEDWKALLFGSLDPSNSITVDKPPLSIWVMGLSARVFGFSSASMLVPQALMAVASVGLLHGTVRRLAGEPAGLIAGTVLALTPAAALMFRFNNPDAAMVLLMVVATYAAVRALSGRGGRWLALAGAALGFAFLAKMLEGLLVLPALGLVYLVAAPVGWRKRILDLLGAAVAMIVSAGWFVVLTMLWPVSSRPYLAGSTDNSFMNLVLGYNGFGRVLGQNHKGGGGGGFAGIPQECLTALQDRFAGGRGGHGGGHGGAGFGQQPGLTRLFTGEWGLEISFLLPAALVALVVVLWLRWGEPRTDLVRAGAILFGTWTVVDGALLAEMKQAAHPYYSLSMAPGIAGLVGIGLWTAWQRRSGTSGKVALIAQIVAGGGWSFALLSQNDGAALQVRWVVPVAAVLAVAAVFLPDGARWRTVVAWLLMAIALLAGPTTYVVSGIAHAQTGGNPSVSTSGDRGGWGRGGASNAEVTALLQGTDAKWAAATNGSSSAASLELASRKPVMAVGGFTGADPSPSLQQFQDDVRRGDVRYYLVSGQGRGGPGGGMGAIMADLPEQCRDVSLGGQSSTTQQVAAWVQQNFTATKVGGTTVYDLTKPVGAPH